VTHKPYKKDLFLPVTKKESEAMGWHDLDVVLFSGDAYVDHPSFGNALIGRFLESLGLRVAIVPQPNWKDDLRDFKKFGKPNMFFAITAGNMDSMINHYTAQKRKRSNDAYTPGGRPGYRPDYATIVYSHILKKLFPDVPLIIGGIEASMRRFTHYDYWSDALKPSILIDSKADYLVYGMAESSLEAIVNCFKNKESEKLKTVPQLAYIINNDGNSKLPKTYIELPSYQSCVKDKKTFAASFVLTEKEFSKKHPEAIIQKHYDKTLIVNPPYPPINTEALDKLYELPFTRKPHFKYSTKESIPAFEMIKNSVTIHRGCFGGCSFCTLAAHQSKFISSRSETSILRELQLISSDEDFKGHISDLGGPSANMYRMGGTDQDLCNKCVRPSCIFPDICKNLNTSHQPLSELYKKATLIEGIKKITIGSGIRYDLLLDKDKHAHNTEYINLLLNKHVSGRLKVAPEHTSEEVLELMRKPSFKKFMAFSEIFHKNNLKHNLKNQLIPYFISAHPGTTFNDMAELAVICKKNKLISEQVQDFTPTPMTLASVMYHTGLNPYTGKNIFVPKSLQEKETQKKFFFYYKKEYADDLKRVIKSIHRGDVLRYLFGT